MLKYPRRDDQFLLPFLRTKKYKVAEALKCLNKFTDFWYRRRDVVDGVCGTSAGVARYQALNISRTLRGKDIHGNTGSFSPC